MTSMAISAWHNMASKGTRGKKKLDNADDPQTPEAQDDCSLRKEDFLNYAYEAEGWEKGMLSGMQTEHEDLQARLSRAGGALETFSQRDLRGLIRKAGRQFFDRNYET